MPNNHGRSKKPKGSQRIVQRVFSDAARLHQAGRLEDAVVQYKRAISLDRGNADAHNNLGVALAQLRRNDEATVEFERALKLDPEHAYAHNNLGNALAKAGRIDNAIQHFESACGLNPGFTDAHKSLGAAFASLRRFDEAVWHYQQVLARNPQDAETHNELGTVLKFQGRFDDAEAHYRVATVIRPLYPQAHYNRAELKKFHPGDAELSVLELLAECGTLPPDQAVYVHFALAKAWDDCGDFARAFEHLRRGNDLKRRQIDYDEPALARTFDRIAAVFDRDFMERFQNEGDPSSTPIFVVGMPRSGSTLVEQILSSHPGIYGAGELKDLGTAIDAVLGAGAQGLRYPDCVLDLDGAALREIGTIYTARLRAQAGAYNRIVDKLPANFIYIGLIHLILPNAKIIYTARDPVDTCLSCYSKLFTEGQQFTYDLAELGRFTRYSNALMAHWRSVLPPGRILDVRYEDVVDDLGGQARRMIEYCGLPWDDRCLSFQNNKRAVSTASAVQIRQPIFRNSLERWRRYEAGLAPLLHELRKTSDPVIPDQIKENAAAAVASGTEVCSSEMADKKVNGTPSVSRQVRSCSPIEPHGVLDIQAGGSAHM